METEDNTQGLLKIASRVESNCEFLTCVRHANPRTEAAKNSLRTLEEYWGERGNSKLNTEAMLQLIVEIVYFHYSCKISKAIPVITSNNVRIEEITLRNSEKRFSLVVWYELQEGEPEEGYVSNNLISLFSFLQESLGEYLQQRKEQRERPIPEQEQEFAIENFFIQFGMLADNEYFRENQSIFFFALEQANVFYEHSAFYRIKNCSVLDFIKSDQTRFSQLRTAKVKDQSLVIEYNKEKTRGKGEQEVLRGKEKEIENNISNFFKTINEKNYFQIQTKSQKEPSYRVKFNYTIREREKFAFEQVLASIQNGNAYNLRKDCKKLVQSKRPLCEIQYFIEYSSEKNHICVKLYNPAIVSSVEASDFLIFRSNVLTFDPVSVSIELSEPKIKGQEKVNTKKVVTFKGSSSFNIKEPPLEKILLLMDITLIASKIYEPQLQKNRYGCSMGRDYQRLATISAKVSHYTKMFLKIAKKVYSD